ncbi:MAG TPA: acyl-[acyl-carrier-protein]--UDP-N-acetylglucosamine O-acyltransferase, partial [Thiotrichaceae bacterium]|nr:acyl-[acyl-carrier-protein]--UDP-N-acetylglucosamine O-acyltransferase [Thiotrichaceae bacterium]
MIDAHALIDPTADIDSDVEVGPYSIIGAKVQIASGSWIGPHVVIKGPTQIGHDNKIYQFASIGEVP